MSADLAAAWQRCQGVWSPKVLQDEARRLTSLGWAVTPLRVTLKDHSLKKQPILSDWLHRGLLGESDMASWRGGVDLLALVLPPGLLLLDFENKNGSFLRDTYGLLRGVYGPLPQRAVGQATLTGGMHALYRLTEDAVDLPMDAKVRLPDGTPVAVDIVRHGYLCAAIYAPGFPSLGPDSDEVPFLPISWLPGIRKRSDHKAPTGWGRGSRDAPSTEPRHELLIDLANTPQGERNNTLLAVVRHLMLSGRWSTSVHREAISAAQASGLQDDEIHATVGSAETFAIHGVWSPFLAWLGHLQKAGVRAPTEAWDIACLLCARMVATKSNAERSFAISDREFCDWLGVDQTVIRRRMAALLKTGLVSKSVRRDSFRAPSEYRLLASGDTAASSITPSGGEPLSMNDERLLTYAAVVGALERIGMGRHRMFQQMDDGALWLPKTGIRVLHALWREEQVGRSLSAMARHTGLDRNTVSRTVKELERHGLVAKDGRSIRLTEPNPFGLLDELAERYDVPDREAARRDRHEAHRESLARHDREHHLGRFRPRSSEGRVPLNPMEWVTPPLGPERGGLDG